MKRKVTLHGPATLSVSLPLKWAREQGVVKGDEIEVEELENNLVIKTKKDVALDRVVIDIGNLSLIRLRFMHALYKKGYDEIELRYDSLDLLYPIQKLLPENFIGYEIVEQHNNYCIIKNVAKILGTEFDNMLRRTFILLKSQGEGVVNAMAKGDGRELQSLRYLESYNNKNTAFCRRLINKSGYSEYKKGTYMYSALEELEKIADEYKYLCDFFLEDSKRLENIDKKIISLFRELNSFYNGVHNLYYEYDIKKTVELFRKRKTIIENSLKLFKLKTERDCRLAHYLVVITQQVANLAALKMEMEM